MRTIDIAACLGTDIRTRSFFRRDITTVINGINDNMTFDFSRVVFISRSVADELYNVLTDYPSIRLTGMTGDVKQMYDVVERGRLSPRVFPDKNIEIVRLNNLEEVRRYCESI